jgi:hypothetical protein
MARIRERWGATLERAIRTTSSGAVLLDPVTSIPPEFLAALIANESGGDEFKPPRFEPRVYGYLQAVARGERRRYSLVTLQGISAEAAECRTHEYHGTVLDNVFAAKNHEYHGTVLDNAFAAKNAAIFVAAPETLLRDLSSSWGLTQIMGYHMVGRAGVPRDLLGPEFNLRMAISLLSGFVAAYALDVRNEFECLFRSWNTGQPYGSTFDPNYAERGLARMGIYR